MFFPLSTGSDFKSNSGFKIQAQIRSHFVEQFQKFKVIATTILTSDSRCWYLTLFWAIKASKMQFVKKIICFDSDFAISHFGED